MTFQEYSNYFENIVSTPTEVQNPPYDNPDYIDYTRLNWSRMNRWLKTGSLLEDLKSAVQQVYLPQQWIVITEPWCGDAAHNVPFIELAARENPMISISYELRDSAPYRIEQYLTRGTKSIPKLVIGDADGRDLGSWGPRPAECQELYSRLLEEKADFEEMKIALQKWYNSNKGIDAQKELAEVIRGTVTG